ncbi:MAG: hypothetical protein AUI14_16005 [Actinobacteria bacterium 13_2_20CM_2_71_6]|nr:MAG: hypothetical protein AUI14_16005 [Actinobacteria bacterium 13_2_20CM_2_71_6]
MISRSSRVRTTRVRTKVVALLVSLAALWTFAAFVTLREGVNLLWVTTLDKGVGKPTESLLSALQQERRLSLVYLGGRRADQRAALADQRSQTDTAAANFRRLVSGGDVQFAASDALRQRLRDALSEVDGLGRARDAVDSGAVDRIQATTTFTQMVDAGFRIYGSLATLDDPEIAKNVRTLIALSRAREVLSQEDTLIAGALAAGRLTAVEYQRFVQLVGAQRFLYSEAESELPAADLADYQQVVNGAGAVRFRVLEDRVADQGGTSVLPIGVDEWNAAAGPLLTDLRGIELAGGQRVVGRATPAAIGVVVRLLLAGGLGLIAVVASVVMSITTARALVRQLERLRGAAWELANVRLPGVVERLRQGEQVDVAVEAPPLAFGTDEIGQVGQAFNAVQQTAVRAAVEQAELRRSVRDVFLNLARRTQALVHRQLTVLDAMERRESNADGLANLFRVDHLATRMRRNAENLIVLSGAAPGRAWRNSVPLVDVIRGAVAEVEEYTRVTVLPVGAVSVVGRAVGDVIHLLAELIENAVSFSPPFTVVQVGGQLVGNGLAVEIEDRGLGMSEADRAAANEQLRNPPEFNLSSTARLGLYVVGRLAMRHGIRIWLKESPYGGTTAVVLLPRVLVADGFEPPAPADVMDPTALSPRTARHALAAPRPRSGNTPDTRALEVRPDPGVVTPVPPAEWPPRSAAPFAGNGSGTYADAVPISPATPAPAAPAPAPFIASDTATTGSGLPRRIRQANLAPPLRGAPPPPEEEPPAEPGGREPEQIRAMMSSYRSGTIRGRADATLQPGTATENATPALPPPGPPPEPSSTKQQLPAGEDPNARTLDQLP